MSVVAPPLNRWSKRVRVGIFAACVLTPVIVAFLVLKLDPLVRWSIAINAAMSVAGFVVKTKLIPKAVPYMLRRNMFGYDINKIGSPAGEIKIPEAQGLVVAIVYLVVAVVFQYFHFTPDSPWLVQYNAALACIGCMVLQGFIDDVLETPSRVKIIFPAIASLPLLMAYSGHTTIVIPKPLRPLLAGLAWSGGEAAGSGGEAATWDLGGLYKVCLVVLVVFCTNSINILAGINGLEAEQTAVIAAAVLLFNIWQIGELPGFKLPLQPDMQQAHLFSIYLILPLLACTLALLVFNWYPSQVFVGDTFTYFAGITLAVVGILGHFSETLLLLMLPQVINAVYFVPQLLNIVPRRRFCLPAKFDPATHRLTGSNDLNLVNLFLRLFGPCTEEQLCIRLLLFQVLSAILCFTARLFL